MYSYHPEWNDWHYSKEWNHKELTKLVKALNEIGVQAHVVKKPLSLEEYKRLEFETSDKTPDRPASEDILARMHLAVDTSDKEWFDSLSEEYKVLKAEEDEVKRKLGMI